MVTKLTKSTSSDQCLYLFFRMNNQDSQLKLAQTHSMLGEINMEQGIFVCI